MYICWCRNGRQSCVCFALLSLLQDLLGSQIWKAGSVRREGGVAILVFF